MASLQDQLKEIEQKESHFDKMHPQLKSLESALENSVTHLFVFSWIILFLIVALYRWHYYHFPTWIELIVIGYTTYISMAILIFSILDGLFEKQYHSYLFKKFKTTRTEYDSLIKERTKIRIGLQDLKAKIRKGKTSIPPPINPETLPLIDKTPIAKTKKAETKSIEEKKTLIAVTNKPETEPVEESKTPVAVNNILQHPNQITPPEKIEEKDISEIFSENKKRVSQQTQTNSIKITPKADFDKLNIKRIEIGKLGEEFIFQEEKRKLKEMGLVSLSEMVKWVSQLSDSHGYDIMSFDEDGSPKYIEVKTTTGDAKTAFYLSELELATLKKFQPYYIICRVYNFNLQTGKGSKFWANKTQLETYYDLEATSYKVNPK